MKRRFGRGAGSRGRLHAVCGATVRAGIPALILSAPLAFGAVRPAAVTALSLATALVALALLGHMALDPDRRRPILGAAGFLGLAFLALVAFQVIPIPAGWIGRLSPRSHQVYADNVAGYGGPADEILRLERAVLPEEALPPGAVGGSRCPLSLDPDATWAALLKTAWYLTLFLLVANAVPSLVSARAAVLPLVLIGTFEAGYGLAEYLSRHQHIFLYAKKHYTESVTGTYINRNHFAGLMELALPAGLGLVLSLRREPRDPSRRSGLKEALVWLAQPRGAKATLVVLACFVMVTGLLLSFSRAGIFLGLLALALAAILARPIWRAGLRRALLVVLLLSAAAVPAYVAGSSYLLERYGALFAERQADDGRWAVWRQTARLGGDFPLLGAGLGSFETVFPAYRPPGSGFFDHAHNDYLELLAEAGWAGLLLLLAGVGACLGPAWAGLGAVAPRERACLAGLIGGMVALLAHGLVDFNGQIPANAALFACAAGAAVSIARGGGARPRADLAARAPVAIAAAGLCVMTFAGMAWSNWAGPARQADGLREVRSWLSMPADETAEKIPQALQRLRAAIEAPQPPPEALALFARFSLLQSQSAGEAAPADATALREAIHSAYRSARLAMQAQPTRAENYLVAALALQSAEVHGMLAAGQEPGGPQTEDLVGRLLARASRLDPSNAGRRYTIGTLYLARDRTEEALEEFAASLRSGGRFAGEIYGALWRRPDGPALVERVTPKDASGGLTLARFHQRGGRYPDAERLYRAALGDAVVGPDAAEGLIWTLLRQERYEEAEAACREAESAFPAAAGRVAFWRGRIAMRRGDPAGAAGHFEAALRAEPDSEEIQWALAEAFCGQREDRPCIARLTFLLDEGSDRFRKSWEKAARLLLARALERQGRLEESLAQYLVLSSLEPGNRDVDAALERLRRSL